MEVLIDPLQVPVVQENKGGKADKADKGGKGKQEEYKIQSPKRFTL